MLDFTSALYLGFRHASSSLPGWASLTAGVPAALGEPAEARAAAQRLASLMGCARATLTPSTLHLFLDLFAVLEAQYNSIHVDAAAYPIACWGAERARSAGVRVHSFPHRDLDALEFQMRAAARQGRRPIVLVDGYCPRCGPMPLSAYSTLAARSGGLVVVDDTQALGILGGGRGPACPLGRGGGGSLRWHGLNAPNVVIGASLAKGFGAPVAVLAGPPDVVGRFEEQAETRVHSSQPSIAAIAAASRALTINAANGNVVRARLASLIRRFKAGLTSLGSSPDHRFFPIQLLALEDLAAAVHARLRRLGVTTVLHRDPHGRREVVSFLITARHSERDIDIAIASLAQAAGHATSRSRRVRAA